MCGLLTPDSGSGTCLGYDIVRDSAQIKRRVGYMTQRFSYWEDLSIRENLDFVARAGCPTARRPSRAHSTGFGLASRADQLTGALSGGWKQRLALAACMLHGFRAIAARRTDGRRRSGRAPRLLGRTAPAGRAGISVLVSTHYMDEAERCHKLAYIAYGELLAQGTSAEIVASQGP